MELENVHLGVHCFLEGVRMSILHKSFSSYILGSNSPLLQLVTLLTTPPHHQKLKLNACSIPQYMLPALMQACRIVSPYNFPIHLLLTWHYACGNIIQKCGSNDIDNLLCDPMSPR